VAQSANTRIAAGDESSRNPRLLSFSTRLLQNQHGHRRAASSLKEVKASGLLRLRFCKSLVPLRQTTNMFSTVLWGTRRGALKAPSRCGRSAPHRARGEGSTGNLRSLRILSHCHGKGWQRRGATAARGRFQSAPPCAPHKNVEIMFVVCLRATNPAKPGPMLAAMPFQILALYAIRKSAADTGQCSADHPPAWRDGRRREDGPANVTRRSILPASVHVASRRLVGAIFRSRLPGLQNI